MHLIEKWMFSVMYLAALLGFFTAAVAVFQLWFAHLENVLRHLSWPANYQENIHSSP